jgi:hypothetical protein
VWHRARRPLLVCRIEFLSGLVLVLARFTIFYAACGFAIGFMIPRSAFSILATRLERRQDP